MITQEKRTFAAERLEKVAGLWLAGLALVFLAPWAYGQAASPSEPAPAQLSGANTHVNVDEVSLDLVVHDKSHKQVLDLKPEDIAVTDDGTPVKLTGFHLVNGEAGNDQLVTLVFDRFEGPTAKSVEGMAEKIVRMFPAKGFSFAVLDYSGRLRLIQGFTDDRQVVEQAVSTVTASKAVRLESTATQDVSIVNDKAEEDRSKAASEAEKNLISIATTGMDSKGTHVSVKDRARWQTLLAALEDSQRIVQDQHAYLSLAGLMALTHSQQELTERKSLVYFTQNYQMDKAIREYLHTIAGAANRAGVSVYVVDMNSLNTGPQGQTDLANAMLNGGAPYDPAAVSTGGGPGTVPLQQASASGLATTYVGRATDFMMGSNADKNPLGDTRSPMAQLATATGGAYIDALSTVKKPLDQMFEDMTTYYQATYIPPFQDYDGKFRPIAVKPLRAGLVVETKTGYLALPPGAEGDIRPFEVPLMKILGQAELPSALKFHAAILKFGELPDGNANTFAVEVPIAALEAQKDAKTGALSEHVSIVAQIKDKNGTVVEHYGEDITKHDTLNTAQEAKTGVIEFQRHFMSVPGQYSLEVAVLDNDNGAASGQRIDFEIPGTPASPSLSDMVLVRQMDPFNPLADPLEPLRYESVKVTPNLAGAASGDGKSLSLFFILHSDPKATEPPTLEMQVFHDGKPGRRTSLPLKKVGNGAAIPYLATFKDGSLAPGHYEVMARITQSGRSSENEILFSVESSQSAATLGIKRTTPQ
jgi:VWFA-related protein